MPTDQENIQQAKNNLRSAADSLRKGEYGAADETADFAYTLVEDAQESLIAQIQRFGTELSPERDKLDNTLTELDEFSAELEQLGQFADIQDQDEANEAAETLEGLANMLDEVSL